MNTALSHCSLKLFCRQDSEYIKEVIKPFDWTFTTDYRGTLTGKKEIIMKVWLNWSLNNEVITTYITYQH